MIQLTDEQWALYEERYGKLMHTISMKISGDDAIAIDRDVIVYGREGEEQGLHGRIEDSKAQYAASAIDLQDFANEQPEDVKTVINAILKNPGILSKDGSINHSALRTSTGLSVHFTNKAVSTLKKSIRKNYGI
jgi:hypothetical protein